MYQGRKGASFKPTSFKDIEKNFDRELTPSEKTGIEELRDWSHDFFNQNSSNVLFEFCYTVKLFATNMAVPCVFYLENLIDFFISLKIFFHKKSFLIKKIVKYVTWWSELREPTPEDLAATKNKYVANEVDLLLKTEKVLKDKKAVEFVDHSGQKHALFLQAPPVLVKDDVIKLRCVNVIFTPEGRIIQLTKNSSCLIIPDYFFDVRLFHKNAKVSPMPSLCKTPDRSRLPSVKKDADGRYTTPMSTKRAATALYPFLNDYEYEDNLLAATRRGKGADSTTDATLVKKSYVHKMPTNVKDLFDLLNNPAGHEHSRFVVSGYILGTNETKLNKLVKKMDDNGKVYLFFIN